MQIIGKLNTFAFMKKITKKRKKQIFSKDSKDMTIFEVLYSIPVGHSLTMYDIFNPYKFYHSFDSPTFSLRTAYNLFNRPLLDSERLLIAAQLRLICERGLIAADLIENELIER